MAKTEKLVGFGLLLKAQRLGFRTVEGIVGDKPLYAATHELNPKQGILRVYTQEMFRQYKGKSPKFIYAWWGCKECVAILLEVIQVHREELETTGMFTVEFPVPPPQTK